MTDNRDTQYAELRNPKDPSWIMGDNDTLPEGRLVFVSFGAMLPLCLRRREGDSLYDENNVLDDSEFDAVQWRYLDDIAPNGVPPL